MSTRYDPEFTDPDELNDAWAYEQEQREHDEQSELTPTKIDLLEEMGNAFSHWITNEGGIDDMFNYFHKDCDEHSSISVPDTQCQQHGEQREELPLHGDHQG